ncbi:MAG: S-layer homology domain-containing protein, partial [Clostridiales bacterium]|nr:S-layer homology domain-containing protein [Clostridiales bacterium]
QGFNAAGSYYGIGASYYPSGGGGVHNNGTFTMTGGAITGNTSNSSNVDASSGDNFTSVSGGYGGGVYNAGVFYFEGGTISNNSASYGGGVYNASATTLEKNSTQAASAGEFYMTGGTLTVNTLLSDTISSTTSSTGGGRTDVVSISACGSALFVAGGSAAVISGGTIEGSDAATASITAADGSTYTTTLYCGITAAPTRNTSSGATGSAFTSTEAADANLTITGSPDISVGVLLVDYSTSTLNALLTNSTADDFDGDDTSTYEYRITSTEATETDLASCLTLDGALKTALTVNILNVQSSTINFTNVNTAVRADGSITDTLLFLNSDGDILAIYNDRVVPNEEDASLFTLSTGGSLYLTTDEDGNDAWAICAHSALEYVEAEAATCTEAGHTEYYQCAGCGALFADENASTALTEEDITVAATGHTWALIPATEATATQTGLTAGVQCSACGAWLIEQTVTAATGDTGDTGDSSDSGDSGDSSSTFLFDDVSAKTSDNEWYYDAVYWAYDLGVTKGTSDTVFSPTQGCTRAQFATFLCRLAQSSGVDVSYSIGNPFSDVSETAHQDYYASILWCYQNGITTGTSDTTFDPDGTITRAQAVTMLYRYATMLNGGTPPTVSTGNSFSDVTNSGDDAVYYDAILWAVAQGITNGTSDTAFSPSDTCNRAMMVTFLYRYATGES